VEFHEEVAGIIRANWPDLERAGDSFTEDEVLQFAQKVAHYCSSRYNLIVTILQALVPAAKVLKRKPIKFRQKLPASQTEFRDLLRELDARPHSQAGLVIRLLGQTGLRIHEARNLKWEDISHDCIYVTPEASKNGKPRQIPFVPGVAETLARLRAVSPGPYVLPQASVKTALRTVCRRMRIRSFSHHDFRHMFATRCIEAGVDAPTVARWMGHQDGGSLLSKMYFHLLDDHSRDMAGRVSI
jgi:integrase